MSSESSNGRQIVISNGLKEPVTDMAVIGNGLKEPVTDRVVIGNGLKGLVTDRFNFRNGRILTSVTKNNCNERLRSPLLEVLIGNGRCVGHVGVEPATLMRNGRQTTTVTDGGPCNGC